jgi:hypothetical protein
LTSNAERLYQRCWVPLRYSHLCVPTNTNT